MKLQSLNEWLHCSVSSKWLQTVPIKLCSTIYPTFSLKFYIFFQPQRWNEDINESNNWIRSLSNMKPKLNRDWESFFLSTRCVMYTERKPTQNQQDSRLTSLPNISRLTWKAVHWQKHKKSAQSEWKCHVNLFPRRLAALCFLASHFPESFRQRNNTWQHHQNQTAVTLWGLTWTLKSFYFTSEDKGSGGGRDVQNLLTYWPLITICLLEEHNVWTLWKMKWL